MKQISKKESYYYDTFKLFLEDVSAKYANRPMITSYPQGEKYSVSYSKLKNDAFMFSAALCKAGLSGKHIALVSENSYEWLVAYFGIVCSGGVVVCVDTEQTEDTLGEMITHADAEAIITSCAVADLCESVVKSNQSIRGLIVIGSESDRYVSFEAFCSQGDCDEANTLFESIVLDGSQTASIVYTSGTTSTAKPVMLSHKAILYNAADSLTLLDSRDRVFNALPLYHTYGFTCGILCPTIRGLEVCINGDLKRMMQEMTAFKPQMIVAVPLIIEAIHKVLWSSIDKSGKRGAVEKLIGLESFLHKPGWLLAPKMKESVKGTSIECLSVILSGGAYLAPEVASDLLHFGIVVLQGYGITECSPSISCNRNDDFSLKSVGVVLPGNEVKFQDDEILVRGYAMMNGYYKAPELTAEAYEDGWFKTGDLGYLDKKNHLHITGRKKNLIVMKNGKKVAVEEIENEINGLPLVKSAMVYPAQSGNSIDDVKIAVSIYPDPQLSEGMSSYEILEKLQSYVDKMNAKMPTYKQIEMIDIRETDFEHTSSHKIKRQVV